MLLRYLQTYAEYIFTLNVLVYFMYKTTLLNNVIKHLYAELKNSELAAKNAHLAATDDQSVAETQYDTLAIEASYLAEGQSRRVDEIKESILLFEQLVNYVSQPCVQVKVGCLVQLEKDKLANAWFYIGPAAGGFTCNINEQTFTLITPMSPMGSALIDKEEGDEVTIHLGNNIIVDYIETIY